MTESKSETFLLKGTAYQIASAVYIVGFMHILYRACLEAYRIRLYAIDEYGRVIHEFDPYFNYRAAEVSLALLIFET
jgi:asparagine N-glycosylation enzyme membrane subunit Stt3